MAEAAPAQMTPAQTKPAQRTPAEARLTVVQVRSAIGSKPKHRGTLRALGLGRIGRSADLPDRPEIRGMLANVMHLVRVAPAAPAGAMAPAAPAGAAAGAGAKEAGR